MAISAVLLFRIDGDARKTYDAVIDEMGVRDNAPSGSIYHFCAPVDAGLQVCDLWQTREEFERFAQERIGPVTAKHGMAPPETEIAPVHEIVVGRISDRKGVGLFVEWDGESKMLLRKIDEANARMNVQANPPEGLIIHWTVPTPSGVRVIDHWRSREDFERFLQARLGETMDAIAMPPPRIAQVEVYNTIDPRVAAHV